jgi:hypothetical protein
MRSLSSSRVAESGGVACVTGFPLRWISRVLEINPQELDREASMIARATGKFRRSLRIASL